MSRLFDPSDPPLIFGTTFGYTVGALAYGTAWTDALTALPSGLLGATAGCVTYNLLRRRIRRRRAAAKGTA